MSLFENIRGKISPLQFFKQNDISFHIMVKICAKIEKHCSNTWYL